MSKKSYIYEQLKSVKVIDTHEHLWDESYRLENPGDWTSLFYHYGITSLKMAGLKSHEAERLYSPDTPHTEKWNIFSRYFQYAKNTSYIKAVLIAINDIYGIGHIDSSSMAELTGKMKDTVKPGFNRKILCDWAGIDYCMVNCFDRDENGMRYPARLWGDIELLKPDLYADSFIYPSGFRLFENETGIDSSTLSGWLNIIDTYFEKHAKKCCSIKIGLAYMGDLDFKAGVSFADADTLYNRHYKAALSYNSARPLADYIFYYIVEKADAYGLPLKFHTGLYSGPDEINFDAVEGNVRHLANLAISHPECSFIAMHMAYPFQDELVMAIRQVSNLYADMSWAWIVDMEASCSFLRKALCAAPVTKVMGFGGDYSLVENTYGHLELTRQAMSGVLSDMAESGYFDLKEACFIGQQLLRGSAQRLYSDTIGTTP